MSGRLFEIGEIGERGEVGEEDWEGGKEENQGQASTAWHRPSHLSTIRLGGWNEQVSKMIPFCAVRLLVVPTKLTTAGRFLLLLNY